MADIEKTLLLFDWDDVLFNTADFKNDFTDSLEELDISRIAVFETYEASKQMEGGHSFENHASLLIAAYPDQAEKIRAVFARTMSRVPGFVYSDAKQFIIAAGLKGAALGVLSAGNEQFQKEKIERSGLYTQFNFITVVPYANAGERKAQEIVKLAEQYEKIVFFEDSVDNLHTVESVLSEAGRVFYVYVNRDGKVHPLPPGTLQISSFDSTPLAKFCFEE